jgi:large conductance mechanosensitive channel
VIAEFREFINRGNFLDIAVGFVMGIAVAGLVDALVERLLMPGIAVVVGQTELRDRRTVRLRGR